MSPLGFRTHCCTATHGASRRARGCHAMQCRDTSSTASRREVQAATRHAWMLALGGTSCANPRALTRSFGPRLTNNRYRNHAHMHKIANPRTHAQMLKPCDQSPSQLFACTKCLNASPPQEHAPPQAGAPHLQAQAKQIRPTLKQLSER